MSENKKNKLTPKQQRFCEEYMVDLNGTQAAIRAGYSDNTARAIASENLTKLDIQAEIVKLKAKISEETGITIKYVIDGLQEVAERCMQKKPVMVYNKEEKRSEQATNEDGEGIWTFDSSGANRSLELLGKHLGMFVNKHEIKGGEGDPIKVEHSIEPEQAKTIFGILERAGALETESAPATPK